jgi:hypothetical protein
MFAEARRARFWIFANACGASAFLWLASSTWREPQLRRATVALGGVGVVWVFTALPILVAFLLIDLLWLAVVIRRAAILDHPGPLGPWLVTGMAWIAAVLLDASMH